MTRDARSRRSKHFLTRWQLPAPSLARSKGRRRELHEVEEFIDATRNVTVAVVRRTRPPHTAPVSESCVEGEISVTASPGSVLANCLDRSPEVASDRCRPSEALRRRRHSGKGGSAHRVFELCGRLDRSISVRKSSLLSVGTASSTCVDGSPPLCLVDPAMARPLPRIGQHRTLDFIYFPS